VDTFVNSIYVFDDRIVATFNYRDKSRTVKLSDIRGSSLLDSAPPGSKETLKYQRFFALKGRAEGSNQNHQTRTRTTESSRSVTDLLLYHRGLQRLIAFDFKRDEVTPSNLGQLSFYLSALNKFVKKPFENDSIGIILCKKQNKAVVELAIQDYKNPIGVATYRFGGEIPAPYQTLIPVIDGVQQILLESSDDSEEEAK
jgi:hypothetical protein